MKPWSFASLFVVILYVPCSFAQAELSDWAAAIRNEMQFTLEFAFGETPVPVSEDWRAETVADPVTGEFLDGAQRVSVRVAEHARGEVRCSPGFDAVYRLAQADDGKLMLTVFVSSTQEIPPSGVPGAPVVASVRCADTQVSLSDDEWTVITHDSLRGAGGFCIAVRLLKEANKPLETTADGGSQS